MEAADFFICTVTIQQHACMQFIAVQAAVWISNLPFNEQNADAMADAGAR